MDHEIGERWPQLASLSVVETNTTESSTGKRRKRERRYYISSRAEEAAKVQKAVRLHGSIENQCHWVLDTAFREDHCQTSTGHAAKSLGTVCRIVPNILNDAPSTIKTLPRKRFEALMNINYRERLRSLA